MKFLMAAALLAAPAGAAAADQDALCEVLLIDTVTLARERPNLPPNLRAALPRWERAAEFFSAVILGRYDDSKLSDAIAAAVAEYGTIKDKAPLMGLCITRYGKARDRSRAAVQRAREKALGPAKPPKPG